LHHNLQDVHSLPTRRSYDLAAQKMVRDLKEFRIRGIKTNVPFLKNVVLHEKFYSGNYSTKFIDETPELFVFPKRKDRGTKLLNYIGDMTVNGVDGVPNKTKPLFPKIEVPKIDTCSEIPEGTKQLLDKHGPEYVSKWLLEQEKVQLT